MIRKLPNKSKWVIISETTGKRLSKPLGKKAAQKRLRQIEYFKHR